MREIQPIARADATVVAPGSKSLTNRGLVLGALATGRTTLSGALRCDDTDRLAGALCDLGIGVESGDDSFRIEGRGGELPGAGSRLFAGASGTALRFLTAVAALGAPETVVDGVEELRRRPIRPLCDALRALGASATPAPGGGAPVRVARANIEGGEVRVDAGGEVCVGEGGEVRIDAGLSSQFLSALLLIGPLLPRGIVVRTTGRPVSIPYVAMTLAVMEDFGVRVERPAPNRFRVPAGAYAAQHYRVEGDWSSAGYLLAAAAMTGGRVRVEGLCDKSLQADRALLGILVEMGCEVLSGEGFVEVTGGDLAAVDVDLGDSPDLAPTVAVLAMRARGATVIRGAAHLRMKESDRIETTVAAVRALSGRAEPRDDGFEVTGGPIRGGVVDPRGDHRIAMAFSLPGLFVPGVRMRDPTCVAKSFPRFYDTLLAL